MVLAGLKALLEHNVIGPRIGWGVNNFPILAFSNVTDNHIPVFVYFWRFDNQPVIVFAPGLTFALKGIKPRRRLQTGLAGEKSIQNPLD